MLQKMTMQNATIDMKQHWGYYESFDFQLDSDHRSQNSGAYIFRPSLPEQKLRLIVPKDAKFVQTVNPLSISDGRRGLRSEA